MLIFIFSTPPRISLLDHLIHRNKCLSVSPKALQFVPISKKYNPKMQANSRNKGFTASFIYKHIDSLSTNCCNSVSDGINAVNEINCNNYV